MANTRGIITGVGSRVDDASGISKNSGRIIGVGSRLDAFQTACDVVGMTEIPIISQGADLISGGISLATGDYIGAALSVGSLLPGVGQATGAAKMARRATKAAPKLLEVTAKGAKKVDAVSDTKLLKYADAKASGKILDNTESVGKNVDAPKSNKVSKKSEVDAKQTKKEKSKEREDVDKSDVLKNDSVQDPQNGKNLDVKEFTYPWEGNRAKKEFNEFADPYPGITENNRNLGGFEHLKKEVKNSNVSQNIQKKNSNSFVNQNKNIGGYNGVSGSTSTPLSPYNRPQFGI